MTTSHLESNASPTQGKSKSAFNISQFEGTVMSDDGIEHHVTGSYEHTAYWMGGLSIWSFDYSPETLPNLSARDFCEAVKDLIRSDCNTSVTFY